MRALRETIDEEDVKDVDSIEDDLDNIDHGFDETEFEDEN